MTKRRLFTAALLVLIALFAALLLLSKHGLSVTRLTLEFSGLPRGFDGFKIVQLSDLHGSEFGQDNARLIEAVAAEEPELIALTGDFLDEGEAGRELPGVEALVRELVKLAPVYFVSGNHDWASSTRGATSSSSPAASATPCRCPASSTRRKSPPSPSNAPERPQKGALLFCPLTGKLYYAYNTVKETVLLD